MANQRTDTDVIDELVTDHHEALQLLDRIGSISDPDERRDLADTVISEIMRHSVSEEMYVYPAMREYLPDGERVVEHDTREHKELEGIMKQLESMARLLCHGVRVVCHTPRGDHRRTRTP